MLPDARIVSFVICMLLLGESVGAFGDAAPNHNPLELRFSRPLYNVSIPENSVGKTYAVQPSGEERLGIRVPLDQTLDVRYKIIGGDRDKFFKAEERVVGDFSFLSIRTRTGNVDVLNRERKDKYVLDVRATATRREGKNKVVLEADTVVMVTILDNNDLNPLFEPREYSITIPEDTPVHQRILKVTAEDADLGTNGEIYYSFLEDTDQFAVHPTSGVVTLTRSLTFSERSLHELTVLGVDRGSFPKAGAGKASRAKVRIRVRQVNLFAPDIYVHALPDILENSNAVIYAIVRVVDKDSGVHGQIKSLDIVDGDPDGHFRIRATSQPGEYNIEVHRLLDRESTPQGYNLTLRAADRGVPTRQSYKAVPVHLSDLNDNAPVFMREIYEVSVPETAPVNTPVIRLKVTDSDEGKNAQVFLEIVGGNEGGEFRINPDTGMLYTAVTLDAELKAFYTLTVSAIDQGNTGTRKQSSAKVKINVQDTNDNDPLFEKPNMTVWVDENEPTGTTVTKVTARDKDSGENAYISYSIANLNEVPFEIDHFSGVVRTTQLLDYESMTREYVLRVRASDWGLPYRRQTEMQLIIKVRDVNDNRPQFEKVDCVGHVPRYVPIGSEVITLSAIDFDAGNLISYRLVSGNEDGCFQLDTTSGVMSVGCDLKDVRVDEREVNVTATDGTHFADIVTVKIHLVNGKRNLGSAGRLVSDETGAFECRDTGVARRLTEVLASAERNNMPGKDAAQEEFGMMPSRYGENVHAPEFLDFPLEIQVNESVALGTTLTKLKARDRDLGYNGKLIFGISSGDNDSAFRLDPDTGELKVVGYLDRERENEYYLNVTVYDLGKPQKSLSRVLPVTILDVNDNAPKFEKSLASFRVTENALNGTAIFRVNATDADLGDNARVAYSLVTDTKDFVVDLESGVLFVAAPLDRERQELYELKIQATDGGGKGTDMPALHSDALVRVTIDDINDNAPKFSLQEYKVRVCEDIPIGSVVVVVSATDPDTGPGGEIMYSLAEEADGSETFKIDKLAGTIRTVQPLDFEERQAHSLVVRAHDRGVPELSSETTVHIEIVDVNENKHAPVFDDFVLSGSVPENQEAGTLVMTVHAEDGDAPGPDSRVGYSIRSGSGLGLFSIDNKGSIRTLAVLDVEATPHYWLTVCAQDQAVVPLHSCVEVFVQVQNENDNVPLTEHAAYYPSISENSSAGKSVQQLSATDLDSDPNNKLSYKIVSGNPEGFFSINSTTGLITTTGRKLDRENQPEHILEVMVSDNGSPPLSSTTRVIVTVDDINDHAPEFQEKVYKVQIPAAGTEFLPVFQNQSLSGSGDSDGSLDLENSSWETFSPEDLPGDPILRVLAIDQDIGENGRITYSIKSGRGKAKFRIHPDTGIVYAQKTFEPGQEYDLMIRAMDNGTPQKAHTALVSVAVVAVPPESAHPPHVKTPDQHVEVTENDSPGYLVALVQTTDQDQDMVWYDIVDGDLRNEFFIDRDKGNVLLAKKLDWETQHEYNITISVTDGVHTVHTQLYVTVIDINDHRPVFTEDTYRVDISEDVEAGTEILQLQATDKDEDKKLFYSLHAARSPSSLHLFKVDSVSGSVSLLKKLDRELIDEHVLTVIVKDQGTPAKRNYARVVVTVHDHNDHAPEFTTKIIQGKVFETSPVGAAVVQVVAIDRDKGDNAKITYAITSGNIGNIFTIDPDMGNVQIARELDLNTASEYMLLVKASDSGRPSLSSNIPVHIMITMADNAPPRFNELEPAAEIYENQPIGSYVIHLAARSTSSLLYDIREGNTDDMFFINPSTGVITTKDVLDYERNKFYNLSITATNMAAASAECRVVVHVLDRNDNAPYFLQAVYKGTISEAAPTGSLVLTNSSAPLVIKAKDGDSELNALLNYDIVESLPRKYFHIDSSTGAIRTVMALDHETYPTYSFHVKVSDLGKPRLSSETTAKVEISVTDVNDCPPKFSQTIYNVTLLLPTYENVVVLQLNASDPDSLENSTLRFDIIEGNKDRIYTINSETGVITTTDSEKINSFYRLHVRVSDGKFSSVAHVNIQVETSENSGLVFQKGVYEGSIMENSTKITTVVVVNVLGSSLNEHILFSILNPTDMFRIGTTSGAIETTGVRFDREVKENYELIVEARSHLPDREKPRVAHVIVNVTILDINDNCPMFVNLPYYAVVSVDDLKGQVITKVHAVDMDSFENGEVRYEMKKGHGELFKVCRKTGEVSLKQNLEGHNREYELIIGAYDGGITPCSTEVTVHVKVIDRSMPVFDKQFYSDSVPENIELHSPLAISIQAESPLSRKLIYSIVKGNDLEEFALDFNTAPDSTNGPCAIYVVDELDYEQCKQYELTVRATDSVSGVFAEVLVSVIVQDVNDCPPEFTQDSYNISVSEAAPFGTPVLRVSSRDNDTGLNQVIQYAIQGDTTNSSEYFHMDPAEGIIYLKKSLDHEQFDSHHFTVMATDKGVPSLSSTAHVWVTVLDMNDNPPKFEQPSYSCFLSQHATRGQFVTIVTASDPDYVDHDRLSYTIVGGNDQQTFSINPLTGIVHLVNMQNFAEDTTSVLNISVTDGVYTSFTRVKIVILPANLNNPVFPHIQHDVKVNENQLAGRLVTRVTATDSDFGEYGSLTYHIQSDLMQESFSIDKVKGEILTKVKLDRETRKLFEIPVMATDGGGRSGFMTVRVKVGDENDNPPEFYLHEYKACIHSNQTINSTFIKFKAGDLDEDFNAKIQYSIYDAQNAGVKELFGINPSNGGLFLLKNAHTWENQLFQFFIRAEDQGSARLHADVPIDVYIMSLTDQPPIFERKEDKFFFSENSQPGTVITRLKMVTNVTATYRIISDDLDNPQFIVDQTGQLSLARTLDRESRDSYLIGILAESDSSPPLTAMAEVTLKVLDENDHAPVFESNPYSLTLAENIEEGTSILRIIAYDSDQGSNGDVRYAFSSDIGDLANVFAIDAFTGWITTLVELDKETKSDYKFQVVATDNGNPKHSARTTVNIKLKDYNDSPPVFKNSFYEAAVNEDALPGTVVVQLATTDKDIDLASDIEYYITSGDTFSQFQIRQTGEVFVAKALDRESIKRYDISVIATDGKFTASVNVSIEILDANDNPPYCLRYRYREVISEGAHPGSYVLTVLANDADEEINSKLRYYLTGNGADKFVLNKDSGHMKTARLLDREKQSRYQLTAHVQDKDRPGWECSSQIEIVISDLNDNTPQFSMTLYSVTLPEDVEVGTLVTKVHATDDDIGFNRKIKYSFIDSANDHFKMCPDSGIVTLAKPLDRELRAMYNLTVQATDQGTPQLSSGASLIVNVQDINDNPPEFTSKYYFAVVPEINAIGSEVVKVLATSKDTGVNAEVYYSIVGGNEHKKFNISTRAGVISISDTLDYERAKDYFLTIQAIDGGIPPLSNLATVNISITDSNDNPPIFNQASYSARIREDAQLGDKILQVTASDLDSDNNGKISYQMGRGDRHSQFAIDDNTGYITVAGELDRESMSSYVLEVHANDNGLPVLTSVVMVNIEISDANDNPPLFSQANYTAIVQEDKPLGYTVLKFEITDADTLPNTAPYTFDFRSGNEGGAFRLEQDGYLRTAARFNHKIKDNYLLQIRVFDNGTPPLFSDTWVVIKVIEESQYPPVITPLEITINSFLDEYPGGVIGKIYASDQDQYDILSFALAPTAGVLYTPSNLFNLSKHDGMLYALPRLDIGDYRVNVTVTDGKFITHTVIKVNVELISEEMLQNSVVVRFREISPQDFVLSHRKGFVRSVRNAMNSRLKDVIIISVQPSSDDAINMVGSSRSNRDIYNNMTLSTAMGHHVSRRQIVHNDLDVLFTVKKPQSVENPAGLYSSDSIRKALNNNLNELEESTKLVVEEIVRFKCTNNYCVFGECHDRVTLDISHVMPISTDVISFVSTKHLHHMDCTCKDGYDGERCETIVNECAREPCPVFKECIPDSSVQGYTCQCPEGYAGTTCDIDISKCHDETCYIPRNPVSFSGKSYAQYRVDKSLPKKTIEDHLVLSLRLRSMQLTGTLMYAAGKVDYNVLEISNGVIQYRFDLGSGEGMVRVSSIYVSDGQWHEIKLERDSNSARLIVDGKHVAHGSAPGINDILNLQSDDLYFGAEVRQHPSVLGFEDIQRGFYGCMDDIRISRVLVPLHMSGASSVAVLKRFANVEFSCDTATVLVPLGACGSQPCMNGGSCNDLGGGNFECNCHSRFDGLLCEIDIDPCASSPCLYGGRCKTVPTGGDYLCDCAPRMTGKRCEYGRYCLPNPCRHGGVCEEGDTGPLCKCRGFAGTLCEIDVDECLTSPCLNGATCVNEPGSFRCICPPNMTGLNCGNPLFSTPITSSIYIITWEELIAIAVAVGVIILVVLLFIIYRRFRYKRSREHANNINNEARKDIVHNSMVPRVYDEFKRGSKLSNLEVIQRADILPLPARPASYTPSSNNEQPNYNLGNPIMLNNLDTLRSYGSAGDELENYPPDRTMQKNNTENYRINLNKTTPQQSNYNHSGATNDNNSLHKPTWSEQMHLQTFTDNKIHNDLKRASPVIPPDLTTRSNSVIRSGVLPGRMNGMPGASLNLEDDPRIMGGYHWDCSDWVRPSQNPLPDITEVPGSEVPDSSSFHSNESNESHHRHNHLPPVHGNVDPSRDIETLDEDKESEYIGDSECDEHSDLHLSLVYDHDNSIQGLNPLDSGSEEYPFSTENSYMRHPDQYLPQYNIHSETDGEIAPLTGRFPLNGLDGRPIRIDESDDEDVEAYGFPLHHKRRNRRHPNDMESVIKSGEHNSLLGHLVGTSNSDLSANLCEIDDSEYEQDAKQLNWTIGVQQTSV